MQRDRGAQRDFGERVIVAADLGERRAPREVAHQRVQQHAASQLAQRRARGRGVAARDDASRERAAARRASRTALVQRSRSDSRRRTATRRRAERLATRSASSGLQPHRAAAEQVRAERIRQSARRCTIPVLLCLRSRLSSRRRPTVRWRRFVASAAFAGDVAWSAVALFALRCSRCASSSFRRSNLSRHASRLLARELGQPVEIAALDHRLGRLEPEARRSRLRVLDRARRRLRRCSNCPWSTLMVAWTSLPLLELRLQGAHRSNGRGSRCAATARAAAHRRHRDRSATAGGRHARSPNGCCASRRSSSATR